ncbi:hypothetical protein [Oceanobacillus senegalensis]|uniref:hypothetical protein n=1 Tax=Oceanobacillus senegalensis TaxID=1936063 RepID=UPI000A31134F|nr:hypothetical protein [Oceanobacillus senegalensis]
MKDVGSTVASGAKEVADFMLLDDVNTLTSSDASLIDRGIATASIIPVGKVLKLRKVDDILKVDADGVPAKKVENVANMGSNKDIKNYRNTFFDEYPELEGSVVVHHAIEQQVLKNILTCLHLRKFML